MPGPGYRQRQKARKVASTATVASTASTQQPALVVPQEPTPVVSRPRAPDPDTKTDKYASTRANATSATTAASSASHDSELPPPYAKFLESVNRTTILAIRYLGSLEGKQAMLKDIIGAQETENQLRWEEGHRTGHEAGYREGYEVGRKEQQGVESDIYEDGLRKGKFLGRQAACQSIRQQREEAVRTCSVATQTTVESSKVSVGIMTLASVTPSFISTGKATGGNARYATPRSPFRMTLTVSQGIEESNEQI